MNKSRSKNTNTKRVRRSSTISRIVSRAPHYKMPTAREMSKTTMLSEMKI